MRLIKRLKTQIKIVLLLLVLNGFALNHLYSQPCTDCREADSLALVALYNATDGANWTNNSNWLTGNLNTWSGLFLEIFENNYRVTSVFLNLNNLRGHIPAELGNLMKLKYLYLHGNKLNGSIPEEISNLPKLLAFSIDNNYFGFNDIASSTILPNQLQVFWYNPQAVLPSPIINTNGNEITLTVNENHPANHYAWYANGVKINGIDCKSYTFIPIEPVSIKVKITNDIYTNSKEHYQNLILETNPIVIEPVQLPVFVSIHNPAPICEPLTVDLTQPEITTGSTDGLTFTYWNDAAATVALTNQTAVAVSGIYYIKGSLTTGSYDIQPVNVVVNSKPTIISQIASVTCPGGNDGGIDLTVSSGNAPYTYNWSNGASTEDINNLSTGNYNVLVTDSNRCEAFSSFIVNQNDLIAPTIIAPSPITQIIEPGTAGIAVDLGQPIVSDNCAIENITNNAPPLFTPGTTSVVWTVTDKSGNSTSTTQIVEIILDTMANNALPVIISISSNSPVNLLSSANVTALFSDDNLVSASWNWGDGSTSNGNISGDEVYGSHIYSQIGLYEVTLTIIDASGETASKVYSYIVVYDSSIGDVTGGGWINSDKGDYLLMANTSDKANFGFVAQYDKKKGVKGNFTFHLNNKFDVKSTNLDWLVVYYDQAIFTGTANVNGVPGYTFMVNTIDADIQKITKVDLLHIIVWNPQGNVIYDNQPGTDMLERPVDQIAQGSVVIHGRKAKGNSKSTLLSGTPEKIIETTLFASLKVYPNPAINVLNIEIPSREEQAISFDITDISGRVITRNIALDVWGQSAWIDLDQLGIKPGFYMLKLQETNGNQSSVFRFIKQ